ncbi:MAG: YraN family protein [Bacillota bacterium]
MSRQRQDLGRLGEDLAASYLKEKGYRLLARNYRCRLGEIDIIALDENVLVFIEVRCRSSDRFGLPQESVQWPKQTKVRKIALHYLKTAGPKFAAPVRFDVLALLFDRDHRLRRLEHIENAF